VRVFVALGKPVDQLLRRRSWPAPLAEFAARLRREIARAQPAPAATSAASNALREHGITPLTAREMEVMALIAERQSIDEIAARLFISSNTVKKHLTNIYSKLNVKSGRQAVTKMRELGILPSVF
jgi:ATP/maltotriose-dependent transcriptional regulator MalT